MTLRLALLLAAAFGLGIAAGIVLSDVAPHDQMLARLDA